MSALSDQLVTFAILAYLVAMISHAVEYAFGNARARVVAAPLPPGSWSARARRAGAGRPAPAAPVAAAGRGRPVGAAGPAGRPGRRRRHRARRRCCTSRALVTRGIAADRMPWGNMYEFVLTVTFIGAAAWLAVLWKRPSLRRLGLFLTLVMVLLLAIAELVLYVPVGPLVPALDSYWFVIHVSTDRVRLRHLPARRGAGGGVPDARRLRAGQAQLPVHAGQRLPGGGRAGAADLRAARLRVPDLHLRGDRRGDLGRGGLGPAWGWDPKETWAFISWVVYAGYLHARATPSVKRNVATWIAVLGFLTMLMNLFGVNIFFTGLHSYGGLD